MHNKMKEKYNKRTSKWMKKNITIKNERRFMATGNGGETQTKLTEKT